jgi:hypothetical protein
MAGAVRPNTFGRVLSGFMGAVDDDDARRRHPVAPARLRPGRDADRDLAHDDARPRRPDTGHRRHAVGRARRHDHDLGRAERVHALRLHMGRAEARHAQTTPTPTSTAPPRFAFDDVVAYFNIDGGGEAAVSLENVSLTLNNNIDRDFVVLGSAEVYSLAQGNADISGSFVIREALNDALPQLARHGRDEEVQDPDPRDRADHRRAIPTSSSSPSSVRRSRRRRCRCRPPTC